PTPTATLFPYTTLFRSDSGRPVRTVVYFRIGRDGQVSLTQIESSSGYAFFDQTALRALLSATPLPPLPAGYADQYLGVHFGFELDRKSTRLNSSHVSIS